jgi:hypothetical protein
MQWSFFFFCLWNQCLACGWEAVRTRSHCQKTTSSHPYVGGRNQDFSHECACSLRPPSDSRTCSPFRRLIAVKAAIAWCVLKKAFACHSGCVKRVHEHCHCSLLCLRLTFGATCVLQSDCQQTSPVLTGSAHRLCPPALPTGSAHRGCPPGLYTTGCPVPHSLK